MRPFSYKYRTYCLFVILLIAAGFAKAQNLKTVTIIQQRSYYLNGGARSMMGGKSRIAIKVDLPPDTRYWYYSFTTVPDDGGTRLLNLGVQVGAAMATSGLGAAVLSQIEVPPGSGSVDVLLLPPGYVTVFLNKENGLRCFRDVSLENARQAVQVVDKKYGTSVYLGLRNPSAIDGINVQVEVVAVVEEADPERNKAIMYCNLGWAAYERGDFEKCLELSKKSLSCDPGIFAARCNIALTHLAQEADEALDEYISIMAALKDEVTAGLIISAALQDIQKLKASKPGLKNLSDIEGLLLGEVAEK